MTERLQIVGDFVNTRSIELGTDELVSKHQLGDWLHDHRLLRAVDRAAVTPAGHRRAMGLREGLRALAVANSGDDPDQTALDGLAALAHELPLTVDVTADRPRLTPRTSVPVDAALATLLAAVAESVADGTWPRFK